MNIKLFHIFNHNKYFTKWDEKSRYYNYQEDLIGTDVSDPFVSFNFFEHFQTLKVVLNKAGFLTEHDFSNAVNFTEWLPNCYPGHDSVGFLLSKLVRHRIFPRNSGGLITRSISMICSASNIREFSVNKNIHKTGSNLTSLKADESLSKADYVRGNGEQVVVMAGVQNELDKIHLILIRFVEATPLRTVSGDFVPIKMICFFIGPDREGIDYLKLGNTFCSALSTLPFQQAVLTAKTTKSLVAAVDDYLLGSVVIGPTIINTRTLIPTREIRHQINNRPKEISKQEMTQKVHPEEKVEQKTDPPKPYGFGKVVSEVKERFSIHSSDYTDAFKNLFKVIVCAITMIFTHMGPTITFGGLMEEYTKKNMGMTETIWSQSFMGSLYSFVSTQPLMMIGPTGPLLIFEHALISFCESMQVPYEDVRVMTGIFMFLLCLVTVFFHLTGLATKITRFTDENFSTVISIVFLMEVGKFLAKVLGQNPVRSLEGTLHTDCITELVVNNGTKKELCLLAQDEPNTFLASSVILFTVFSTASLCTYLSRRRSLYRQLRSVLNNFKLAWAILVGYTVYYFCFSHLYIPLVDIPSDPSFINPSRTNWIIIPQTYDTNTALVAFASASLLYILIFVETQITLIILSKSEFGLKKPTGLNWDLLLISFFVMVCSLLGLPWVCPGAVQSIVHVSALTSWKKTAPGERPQIENVCEQRVSGLTTYFALGVLSKYGSLLRIPKPCLYGVFLFLAVHNFINLQLWNRIKLMFVSPKHYPKKLYTQVSPVKMHIFTIIQIACVAAVILVKMNHYLSAIFPLVLLLIIFGRQNVLPYLFSGEELEKLDNHGGEDEVDPDDVDRPGRFVIPV